MVTILVAIWWKMDDDPNSYAHKKKVDDFIADLSLRIYPIMFEP